jgi:hypothetical protein
MLEKGSGLKNKSQHESCFYRNTTIHLKMLKGSRGKKYVKRRIIREEGVPSVIYSKGEDNKGNSGWNNREDAGLLKDSTQNNIPKEAMF